MGSDYAITLFVRPVLFLLLCSFLANTDAKILVDKKSNRTVYIEYGEINKYVSVTLDKYTEYLFDFSNPAGVTNLTPAHILVDSTDATSDHPVLIVLRQAKGVLSWQIPFIDGDMTYMTTSRVLCPDVNYFKLHDSLGQKGEDKIDNSFFVSLSSGSDHDISVNMNVTILHNFTVKIGRTYHVPEHDGEQWDLSPSQPWYYQFVWPEKIDSVVLSVHSNDTTCMTMSIQHIACPVLDLEKTVGYEGFRQTMDYKGGVTITKDQFPKGFYLVFVVNGDDSKCLDTTLPGKRSKAIQFDISERIGLDKFIIAVMLPIVLLACVYFLFLITAIVCVCRPFPVSRGSTTTLDTESIVEDVHGWFSNSSSPKPSSTGAEPESQSAGAQYQEQRQAPVPDDLSLDEINVDVLDNAQENIFRTNRFLYVCHLARKDTRILRRKSDLYFINLVTIALFYALPVFQLMLSYQSILQKTGNQDTCFYNFLCAYPQRISDTIVIGDFNHVFSNIGYIAFGFLFIIWTSRRDTLHRRAVSRRPELDSDLGIPQHYGLFYALGLALMMEGFLSGMYHVCPNQTNFQFDTSFMYVIAVLCMVKLYQNRHPDINASAYMTFLVLAFIIFIGTLGINENSYSHGDNDNGPTNFLIFFSVLHLGMCLYVSVQVYHMGRLSVESVRGVGGEIREGFLSAPRQYITPKYPSRLALLIVGNVSNWILVYVGFTDKLQKNFGTYLLTVLLVNLVLYYIFYIVMKLLNREKICLEPLLYLLAASVLWGCAGYFFLSRVTSWSSTPAESRQINEKCNFMQFYDNHDIWHFLSAASMFCTFMVLLTLDDDLVEKSRSEIPVF